MRGISPAKAQSQIRNSNIEIRNKFKIRNPKLKVRNKFVWNIWFLSFDIVSSFGFRASNLPLFHLAAAIFDDVTRAAD